MAGGLSLGGVCGPLKKIHTEEASERTGLGGGRRNRREVKVTSIHSGKEIEEDSSRMSPLCPPDLWPLTTPYPLFHSSAMEDVRGRGMAERDCVALDGLTAVQNPRGGPSGQEEVLERRGGEGSSCTAAAAPPHVTS